METNSPFQKKRAEIEEANLHGIEPPRCLTCKELIQNLHRGQLIKYCSPACRQARTAKGKKRQERNAK